MEFPHSGGGQGHVECVCACKLYVCRRSETDGDRELAANECSRSFLVRPQHISGGGLRSQAAGTSSS